MAASSIVNNPRVTSLERYRGTILRFAEKGNHLPKEPRLTFGDAQRAIYIDFERPKGSPSNPPRPALLGILVGGSDEELEQLIVDDRLAAPVKANPRCRVGTPESAAADLLAR